MGKASLLAAALALAGVAGRASPPGGPGSDGPIAPDRSLVEATLPNGLRYALLPQGAAPGRVSLRLVVLAGSLDEREDERGYAHFIEHMAFSGTRHYPPGRLVPFFERMGLVFGADLNANTSFTRTTYKLDLPFAGALDEGLGVLRDYADGLLFEPAAVDRQRGVILSESRARATGPQQIQELRLERLYAGTGLDHRLPIGDAALVAAARPPALRALYRRVYLPSRMVLVVVGGFSPADAEALIEKRFGTLAPTGGPDPREPGPPLPGLNFDAIGFPFLQAAVVELARVAPRGGNTWRDLETEAAETVALTALNRRLVDRGRSEPAIGRAMADTGIGPDGHYREFRLKAEVAPLDWQAGVRLVEQELRRALSLGFSEEEIREAAAAVAGTWRARLDQLAASPPSALSDAVADTIALGRPWPDRAGEWYVVSGYLRTFTASDATDALRRVFDQGSRRLMVFAPTAFAPRTEDVRSAWDESARMPLAAVAPEAAGEPQWHYPAFGPAGTVAARSDDPALRLEEIRFGNGVRLNLRPGSSEPGRFQLCARAGRGIEDTPRDYPGLEMLAVGLLTTSDLGRNTREDIDRLVSLHGLSFAVNLVAGQLSFDVSGPSRELGFALRLIAAILADTRLDPARFGRALGPYALLRERETQSAGAWAALETSALLAGGDPRLQPPPVFRVASYPFAEAAAWLEAVWLHGPLEVGITGDIAGATAIEAAASTIGALPARLTAPPDAPPPLVLTPRPGRFLLRRSLADRAAALRLAWPSADLADPQRRWALRLAVDVLVDRLRSRLREEIGATYAPSGDIFWSPAVPAFGYAYVDLTLEPEIAPAMAGRALAIADALARDGPTREEVARLRPPLLGQVTGAADSDAWWLNQALAHLQSYPGTLLQVRTMVPTVSALTRDQVGEAARRLSAAAATAVLILPDGPER